MIDIDYIVLLYTKFYSDFQHFIFTNNILITASGFTIGMATNKLITDNIKIISPIFTIFYNKLTEFDKNSKHLSILYGIILFILNIFIWIITIIFSFILLEYILYNKIFGLKSTLKDANKKDFIISKTSAKQNEILPSTNELKKLELKQKTDEIVANKIIKNEELKDIKTSVNIIETSNNTKELYNNFMLYL